LIATNAIAVVVTQAVAKPTGLAPDNHLKSVLNVM
jgi:hypothetical protein